MNKTADHNLQKRSNVYYFTERNIYKNKDFYVF